MMANSYQYRTFVLMSMSATTEILKFHLLLTAPPQWLLNILRKTTRQTADVEVAMFEPKDTESKGQILIQMSKAGGFESEDLIQISCY